MEEKNGKIVEIVESTEIQKQQKKNKRSLRIMLASLILVGSVGYGAMNLSQGDSKEEQPAVSTEYQMSSEFDGVENSNISTDKANVVRLDNREDAISALMSTGMSKEEALEEIRAAEEKAAQGHGAITQEQEQAYVEQKQEEALDKIQAAEEKAAKEHGAITQEQEQAYVADERQQFLDKINQKIAEMNQRFNNTDVNEQSVSEGKTR